MSAPQPQVPPARPGEAVVAAEALGAAVDFPEDALDAVRASMARVAR